MSEKSALGGICLGVDSVQHASRPKLASVKPGSVEGFYMLAAFCFDAARKMEYIFKATREFGLAADQALAAEIKRDNDAVKEAGGSEGYWKETAERLEEIIIRLYKEVGREHEQLLERVAGGR
jgi:hypothetical protein